MSGSSISLAIGATDQTGKVMAAIQANMDKFATHAQRSGDRAGGALSRGINATSSSIDRMSARFEAAKKRIEDALAPVRRLQASVSRFQDASGLNRIAGGFRSIARAGGDAYQKVGQLIPLVGIVGSAASVAGVSRMSSAWAEWGQRIGNASQRIGIAGSRLSTFQGAAALAGSSGDAMTAGLQGMGQALYDAAGGRNTQAMVMARTLNFTAEEMKDSQAAMFRAADWIKKANGHPYAQAQIMGAFNIPEELLPAMRKGADGLREYMAVAQRLNPVTERMIAAAERLHEAQSRVGLAVDGLRNKIAERLEPVLTPMLTHFSDWIATSPAVAKAIDWLGDAVGRLSAWIEGINWDKVSEKLDAWGEKIKAFLQLLARLGVLPDLTGVSGDSKAPATSPTGKGFGEDGAPTAPPPQAGTESNGWVNWGRNIATEANPLHWTPWYHPQMQPVANAPNGVPQAGPRFGPQRMPSPDQAPNRLGSGSGDPSVRAGNASWAGDMAQLQGYGWTKAQAAGILGNFDQESGGRANAVGDGGSAYGLAQLHADRQANFTKLFGHDIRQGNRFEQVAFTNWELHNTEKRAGEDLARQSDARGAAASVRQYYERPRNATGQEDTWRGDRAERMMNLTAPQAQAAPLAAPQAQGAPMQLASPVSSAANDSRSTVRVEFGGKLPTGLNMQVANPDKADIGGPLVERPQLLGTMP